MVAVRVRIEVETAVEPAADEADHAHRLRKSLRAGIVEPVELTIYDVGLLRCYCPWVFERAGE